MDKRDGRARVVVVARDDASTITDCLDGIATHCPPEAEVVVVDRSSTDGTADVAIRHPRVDRVTVVPPARAHLVVEAGARDARWVVLIGADTRPAPGWWEAASDGLDRAPVVLGADQRWPNLAVDRAATRTLRLLGPPDDLDQAVRRAHAAGLRSTVCDRMEVIPATRSAPVQLGLPVTVPPPADTPRHEGLVSVVVCTKDRLRQLDRCLASLARLDDGDHELIVVDNHRVPTVDPVTLPSRARLVHEPRPGLDAARNRGIAEAAGEVVAYVDDDCEVDPHWITALRVSFVCADVALVTGRVRPASLAGPTQRSFESHFGFDRGLVPRRFTPWDDRPWYPLWTGALGTGCNMAIRRETLVAVGGFDEELDVGSTVGGGGDLDLFARILDRGLIAAYTPDALVWHHHRDHPRDLARQFRGYGQAGGAVLMKAVLERPGQRFAAIRFFGDRFVDRLRVARDIRAGVDLLPPRLLALELQGFLAGPLRYVVARQRARRR